MYILIKIEMKYISYVARVLNINKTITTRLTITTIVILHKFDGIKS